eukprot:Partr_v1_DN25954_c0_g1_i8_m68552 putative phosphatidylinositol glycan anchor biosynthesis, class C
MATLFCPRDGYEFRDGDRMCQTCQMERKFVLGFLNGVVQPRGKETRWRKLLYVKQDFPDNHVDETFLEEMVKNANVRWYDYWTLVRDSAVITQHMSTIVIFTAVFVQVYDSTLSIHALILVANALTLLGYVFWEMVLSKALSLPRYTRVKTLKGTILFFTTLLGLSPILKTLTQDTSDDTIWALTFCFFFINMLFHDYSSTHPDIKYTGSLSTNAAIFSSVLLASRLNSNTEVFGLMMFAIDMFALFPIFRRAVRNFSPALTIALSVLLVSVTIVVLLGTSLALVTIYAFLNLFITFACPFWLIWIQRYKNEIRGPWDEAKLVLSKEYVQ